MGIIGPNGSGKTTLLRTISRVLRPSVGTVSIDERDVYSMGPSEAAQKIAVVPQDGSVNFNFTSLEIVMMGRNPHLSTFQLESHKDLRVAKRAMVLTKCLHLANRRINELSGGERRRVLIARALAQEPSVLLLDEPTLNLDINNQIELMRTISKLRRDGGIVVLSVFHDFNLAARYADSIILIDRGRIFSVGTPEQVLTEDNLREVFKVDAEISRHPVTRLNVMVLSTMKSPAEETDMTEVQAVQNESLA